MRERHDNSKKDANLKEFCFVFFFRIGHDQKMFSTKRRDSICKDESAVMAVERITLMKELPREMGVLRR